jgi:hypothetical protein
MQMGTKNLKVSYYFKLIRIKKKINHIKIIFKRKFLDLKFIKFNHDNYLKKILLLIFSTKAHILL